MRFLIHSCLGFLLTACLVFGERFYVNAAASPGGDGRSWATAFTHLQDALDRTLDWRFDEIWIAGGFYYPDLGASYRRGDRRATFVIRSGVTVWGGFAGWESRHEQRDPVRNRTVLSGGISSNPDAHSFHVVTMRDATLDGVEISNGNAIGEGDDGRAAAIRSQGNNTLRNVVVRNNRAVEGAVTVGGDWTVINSVFRENRALARGGVASGGNWRVFGSVFLDNTAPQGGVAHGGSWWDVRYSDFFNNSAFTAGVGYEGYWRPRYSRFVGNFSEDGGVAFNAAWVVSDSVFQGNQATNGAVFKNSTVQLVNVAATGNLASSVGGFSEASNVTAVNTVFTGHRATGGGIGFRGDWSVTNSTFYDNLAVTGSIATQANWQMFNSIIDGANHFNQLLSFTNSRTLGFPVFATFRSVNIIRGGLSALPPGVDAGGAEFVLDVDPGFTNPANPPGPDGLWGTEDDGLRLTADSPGVNRGSGLFLNTDELDVDGNGNSGEALPIDFAGYRRVQDGHPDLGAYERGTAFGRAPASIPSLGFVWRLGPRLKISETFGQISVRPRGIRPGFFSYSLGGWIVPHLEGFSSPQFGTLFGTGVSGWLNTEWFGGVHFGVFANAYNGFVFTERFGWVRMVEAGTGEIYLWVPRLQTWLAMMGDGSFFSFDFGLMVPQAGTFTRYDSNLGTLFVDDFNADGFIRSDRFGWIWFNRNSGGVWFYSYGREEWIGVLPNGGLWSTKENRYL